MPSLTCACASRDELDLTSGRGSLREEPLVGREVDVAAAAATGGSSIPPSSSPPPPPPPLVTDPSLLLDPIPITGTPGAVPEDYTAWEAAPTFWSTYYY